jgi:hypothetical protein
MFPTRLFAASALLAVGLLVPAFAEDEKKDKDKGDDKPNPAVKKLNRDIARHKLFLKRIEDTSSQSTSASAATRPATSSGVSPTARNWKTSSPRPPSS